MAGNISRALASPEKVLMACPPLTYGAVGIAVLAFIFSGLNPVPLIASLLIFQTAAIVMTIKDPDIAYVIYAWVYIAKGRVLSKAVDLQK